MSLELSPVLRSRYLVFFVTVRGWWYCSVAQLCLILCNCNGLQPPAFPVIQYLLEFAQIYVHWVSDTAQPSHPPLPPSTLALNLAQYQGLFQWVSSLNQVAKLLELQHQSFQWAFWTDFLWDGLVGSPCIPRDSQESSPTPQFKSTNSLAFRFIHRPTPTSIHDYWKNHSFGYTDLCWQSNISAF